MTISADLKVLDRNAAEAAISKLASVACPLLDELTNVGTIVYGEAQSSQGATRESTFPVLASLLHVLEMNDSISVLIRRSCSWASVPACRSLFEALLSIEYIAKSDSERRAASWTVCSVHSMVRRAEMGDPRTLRGKEFLATVAKDKTLGGWGKPSQSAIDRIYSSSARTLEHPRYSSAEVEYQALQAKLNRPPNWYSLFAGPRDIQQLALQLERGGQYELLYRDWSDVVHPLNLGRFVKIGSGFPPESTRLRDPKVAAHLAFCVASLVADAIEAIGSHFALERHQYRLLDEASKLQLEVLRYWDHPLVGSD